MSDKILSRAEFLDDELERELKDAIRERDEALKRAEVAERKRYQLPGTYLHCGNHYYASVRGDEECPICAKIKELEQEIKTKQTAFGMCKILLETAEQERDEAHKLASAAERTLSTVEQDYRQTIDRGEALQRRITAMTTALPPERAREIAAHFEVHDLCGDCPEYTGLLSTYADVVEGKR